MFEKTNGQTAIALDCAPIRTWPEIKIKTVMLTFPKLRPSFDLRNKDSEKRQLFKYADFTWYDNEAFFALIQRTLLEIT